MWRGLHIGLRSGLELRWNAQSSLVRVKLPMKRGCAKVVRRVIAAKVVGTSDPDEDKGLWTSEYESICDISVLIERPSLSSGISCELDM
jgi:hypothetical protein